MEGRDAFRRHDLLSDVSSFGLLRLCASCLYAALELDISRAFGKFSLLSAHPLALNTGDLLFTGGCLDDDVDHLSTSGLVLYYIDSRVILDHNRNLTSLCRVILIV